MKLQDAIIMGRFMGLQSVDECYHNAELHYFSVLPYDKVEEERAELVCELSLYDAGYLGIDWEFVDDEVKKQNKEFIDYCEANPPSDEDFNMEDWRKG